MRPAKSEMQGSLWLCSCLLRCGPFFVTLIGPLRFQDMVLVGALEEVVLLVKIRVTSQTLPTVAQPQEESMLHTSNVSLAIEK